MMAERFRSASIHWGTPDHIFQAMNDRFGFTLDACAENAAVAKVERFISPEQDTLKTAWSGKVWMNPPYGRVIGKFLQRASEQLDNGNAELCVALLPNSTGTVWFHDHVVPHIQELILLRKRVEFIDIDNSSKGGSAANFDSIIVVMKPRDRVKHPIVSYLSSRQG